MQESTCGHCGSCSQCQARKRLVEQTNKRRDETVKDKSLKRGDDKPKR